MGPCGNIITLNVGGNKFCTSRNTLERVSQLAAKIALPMIHK